jgi:hypothetical protein
LRLINTVERNVSHQKEYMQNLKQLLVTVRMKIDAGNLEEALAEISTEDTIEDYGSHEKLLQVVRLAYQEREEEIPLILDKISQMENDIKKHEMDLKSYERQSKGVKGIFTHLAGEKFNSIVEIQSLMQQKTKKLSFWKVSALFHFSEFRLLSLS